MSDFSVVEPTMSYTGVLGPNASFVGPFQDVTQWISITTTAIANVPPALSNAIQYEWSTDGINLDSTMQFGSDAQTQQTVHSSVRAQYLRVRYTTGAAGSTGIRVQTLLRNGPINASISRLGIVTGAPDAFNVNGVVLGKLAGGTYVATRALPDLTTATDSNLVVVPPLPRSPVTGGTLTASLTSVQITIADLGNANRRWMTIFNDTTRGNLYLRFVLTPTLVLYDIKVPPQHLYTLPQSWQMFGGVPTNGRIFGIWDVADGFARMNEGI